MLRPLATMESSAIGGALLHVRELGVEPADVPAEVRRGVPAHAGRDVSVALLPVSSPDFPGCV